MTGAIRAWLDRPTEIERLALLRIAAPLAILGFMSSRVAHADHWIGDAGFSVPDLGGDWRQPLYLSPLSSTTAWAVAGLLVAACLATAAGFRTRLAAGSLALIVAYVALADRLSTFTVTKLSPAIALAICFSAAGARYGVDSWRAVRSEPGVVLPSHAPAGAIRFVQLFLPAFYFASGYCKANGDWLSRSDVLWTHLHDSYQTTVTHWVAGAAPGWSWGLMQHATLLFELGAPLWFALPRTRHIALGYAVAMHVAIGLMFGPVRWFALLMISLLLSAYLPARWLQRLFAPLAERSS